MKRKKNRKGQVMLLGMMIAIFMVAFAIATLPALKSLIDSARDSAGLDCSTSTISTGARMACLIVDLILPYFAAVVIFGGLGYILARKTGVIGE
ncbi:MAG: hypothetical protein JSW08_02025 [archaeon]|nr:MAG: hypothetical protein JSW08_02025 [archaeon]